MKIAGDEDQAEDRDEDASHPVVSAPEPVARPNRRPAAGLTVGGRSGMIPGGDLRRRSAVGQLKRPAVAPDQ